MPENPLLANIQAPNYQMAYKWVSRHSPAALADSLQTAAASLLRNDEVVRPPPAMPLAASTAGHAAGGLQAEWEG